MGPKINTKSQEKKKSKSSHKYKKPKPNTSVKCEKTSTITKYFGNNSVKLQANRCGASTHKLDVDSIDQQPSSVWEWCEPNQICGEAADRVSVNGEKSKVDRSVEETKEPILNFRGRELWGSQLGGLTGHQQIQQIVGGKQLK